MQCQPTFDVLNVLNKSVEHVEKPRLSFSQSETETCVSTYSYFVVFTDYGTVLCSTVDIGRASSRASRPDSVLRRCTNVKQLYTDLKSTEATLTLDLTTMFLQLRVCRLLRTSRRPLSA